MSNESVYTCIGHGVAFKPVPLVHFVYEFVEHDIVNNMETCTQPQVIPCEQDSDGPTVLDNLFACYFIASRNKSACQTKTPHAYWIENPKTNAEIVQREQLIRLISNRCVNLLPSELATVVYQAERIHTSHTVLYNKLSHGWVDSESQVTTESRSMTKRKLQLSQSLQQGLSKGDMQISVGISCKTASEFQPISCLPAGFSNQTKNSLLYSCRESSMAKCRWYDAFSDIHVNRRLCNNDRNTPAPFNVLLPPAILSVQSMEATWPCSVAKQTGEILNAMTTSAIWAGNKLRQNLGPTLFSAVQIAPEPYSDAGILHESFEHRWLLTMTQWTDCTPKVGFFQHLKKEVSKPASCSAITTRHAPSAVVENHWIPSSQVLWACRKIEYDRSSTLFCSIAPKISARKWQLTDGTIIYRRRRFCFGLPKFHKIADYNTTSSLHKGHSTAWRGLARSMEKQHIWRPLISWSFKNRCAMVHCSQW